MTGNVEITPEPRGSPPKRWRAPSPVRLIGNTIITFLETVTAVIQSFTRGFKNFTQAATDIRRTDQQSKIRRQFDKQNYPLEALVEEYYQRIKIAEQRYGDNPAAANILKANALHTLKTLAQRLYHAKIELNQDGTVEIQFKIEEKDHK